MWKHCQSNTRYVDFASNLFALKLQGKPQTLQPAHGTHLHMCVMQALTGVEQNSGKAPPGKAREVLGFNPKSPKRKGFLSNFLRMSPSFHPSTQSQCVNLMGFTRGYQNLVSWFVTRLMLHSHLCSLEAAADCPISTSAAT